jgi:hypothetical protein
MSKPDHTWAKAARANSVSALAAWVHGRVGESKPTARALANTLAKRDVAWLAKRPAYVDALVQLTGLPRAVFEGAGDVISFEPLLDMEPFDPRLDAPADIVNVDILSLLVHSGVSVVAVPPGHGRTFWTAVVRALGRAEVHERSLESLVAEVDVAASGALLLCVNAIPASGGIVAWLNSLARSARPVVILCDMFDVDYLQREMPVRFLHLELKAKWRPTLIRWLWSRRKLPNVDRVLGLFAADESECVSTPRDVVDALALLDEVSPRRSLALSSLSPDDALARILRRRDYTKTNAARLLGELRSAIQRRALSHYHPWTGALSRDEWVDLGLANVDDHRKSGLLRGDDAALYAWPAIAHVNEARLAVTRHLKTGQRWGLLCLEPARRRVVHEVLAGLEGAELNAMIDTALVDDGSIDRVAEREALFAAVAARFDQERDIPDNERCALLLRAVAAGWWQRYPGVDPPSPVTRPGVDQGEEGAAFVADCWTWSLHFSRIEVDALPCGLFPGWSSISWTTLPVWWRDLPVADAGRPSHQSERLQTLCAALVEGRRIAGDAADVDAVPMCFLPALWRTMVPGPLVRTLLSSPSGLKAAVTADAARVWTLAVRTEGLRSACRWMEHAAVPAPPAHLARQLVAGVNDDDIRHISRPFELPKVFQLLVLRRQLEAGQEAAMDAVMRLCFEETLAGLTQPPAASPAAIEDDLLAVLRAGLTLPSPARREEAARLLWAAAPKIAEDVLRESITNTSHEGLDAMLGAVVSLDEHMAAGLSVLEELGAPPSARHWLRRVVSRHPRVAERAWALERALG